MIEYYVVAISAFKEKHVGHAVSGKRNDHAGL